MMRFIRLLPVVLGICIVLCAQFVEARIGISLGSGLTIPTGSFNIGPIIGDAKPGPEFNMGIDVYFKEDFSVGVFGNIDLLYAGPKAVLTTIKTPWGYYPISDNASIKIVNYSVIEAGGLLRYFFGNANKWRPFGKIWLGTSGGNVFTSDSGESGEYSVAYGIGFGAMRELSSHFRISGDINYNHSKMDKSDTGANSSRVNIGIALIFL